MTSCDTHDARLEGLKRLRSLAPDPERADRVRMRCRGQLARSRKGPARAHVMTGSARRLLARVVVGGFFVLYIAALVTTTLRLHGVFN